MLWCQGYRAAWVRDPEKGFQLLGFWVASMRLSDAGFSKAFARHELGIIEKQGPHLGESLQSGF